MKFLCRGNLIVALFQKDNGIMEELYQEEFTISPFTSPK